jgi:hypothetical protein
VRTRVLWAKMPPSRGVLTRHMVPPGPATDSAGATAYIVRKTDLGVVWLGHGSDSLPAPENSFSYRLVSMRGTRSGHRHGCKRPKGVAKCCRLAFCLPSQPASFVSRSQVQSCELCPTTAGATMWCAFVPSYQATRKPFRHDSRQNNKLRTSVHKIVATNYIRAANIPRQILSHSGMVNIELWTEQRHLCVFVRAAAVNFCTRPQPFLHVR